jgi:FixJ family two-component response regulator
MVMPDGVNGRELAEQLWKQRPGLKVIFTSGHSLETVGKDKDFLQKPNRRFLQKPFPTRTLVETVRRCLDGN